MLCLPVKKHMAVSIGLSQTALVGRLRRFTAGVTPALNLSVEIVQSRPHKVLQTDEQLALAKKLVSLVR